MPLLAIKNLSISFSGQSVIENFSLTLNSKKITAIVGPSGSGKSVTALAILGLLPKAKILGEILFDEKVDLRNLGEREFYKIRGKEIGVIFQDPNTSLNPLHKISKQVAEAITIHNPKISKKDLRNRVAELLRMVELEFLIPRLDDYPHQLSGGQKQRVMMAIALANNPKILIADEPTTALDCVVQAEILRLLLRLRDELGIAILLITHNLKAVKKIADEVITIGDKNLSTVQQAQQSSNRWVQRSNIFLSASNLSVFYKKTPALSAINFSLKSGENLGVIGESGSGKSTLALALLGLIPSQGELKFFNEQTWQTWQKNEHELRRKVQIVFQDPFSSLNPRMTVEETIAEGLIIHEKNLRITNYDLRIDEILNKLHLPLSLKSRYPHQLSGGQRQRVAIARALILNPQILVLDEPTSALDVLTQNEILGLLLKIQQEREISYILISHDLDVVLRISDKIAVLKDGKILELDGKEQLISNPRHSYTKQLISNF